MPHAPSIAHDSRAPKERWLTAPLLAAVPGLVHGFSTRALGDQSLATPDHRWVAELGMAELALLRQVHGTVVVAPAVPSGAAGGRPEGDAWAGRPEPGRLLGILTADCLPVVLVHPPSGRLAVIHAGWRGAVGGVAEAALAALGVPAGEVLAALGPAIGPCCYQVGEEVAAAVGARSPHLSPWPGAPGHCAFDLPGALRERLLTAGVRTQHIDPLAPCTHCDADRFYSHRRAAEPQRLVAFAGWRPGGRP
ncbi:MAG: polyphenol oxidase family protein [Deferrisomatales bacterium]|nr:polyphenol oxidase family protein [Deferrisomatales bacterium]